MPRRPGWRRHVPLALAGLATAALIGALARPQVSVAVPSEQATIVLAMDHSGSMMATDVAPSRLVAARDAGEAFLEKVPKRVRVGGVVFNHRAAAVASPTTDRDGCKDAFEAAMTPSGGTATGDALATSLAMIKATKAPGAIVLLSDGKATHGQDPLPIADEAKRLKIPIYTVALGTASGTLPERRRGAAGHGDAAARSRSAPAARRSPPTRPRSSARSTRSSAPRSRPRRRSARSRARSRAAPRSCC